MNKRKIATSINVRVNVGNYQHIEISKYAESEIEFKDEQDRIKLEDELQNDIVKDIIRSMRSLPEKLGKKTDAIERIEESITKSIPEWLNKNPVPNLAKKNHNDNIADQKQKITETEKKSSDDFEIDEEDLFG